MWPVRSSAVRKRLYVAHIFHLLGALLLQRRAVWIWCGTGTRAGCAGVAAAVAGGLFVQGWPVRISSLPGVVTAVPCPRTGRVAGVRLAMQGGPVALDALAPVFFASRLS